MVVCGDRAASVEDDEKTGDIDFSFNCNESRGALHRYQMMVDGQSRKAQREALRAIPPVFSDGRVIEPDTTGIDSQMMQAIQP